MSRKTNYTDAPEFSAAHCASMTMFTAFRIATKYADRLPTAAELQRDHGMSRATSYRWVAALREARGIA